MVLRHYWLLPYLEIAYIRLWWRSHLSRKLPVLLQQLPNPNCMKHQGKWNVAEVGSALEKTSCCTQDIPKGLLYHQIAAWHYSQSKWKYVLNKVV